MEPFDMEAEIAAIRNRMAQPLAKEQIVANELFFLLDGKDLASWTNDDWLQLAHNMIEVVKVARDISAEEAAKAMKAPWPKDWPPLPTFDEL